MPKFEYKNRIEEMMQTKTTPSQETNPTETSKRDVDDAKNSFV